MRIFLFLLTVLFVPVACTTGAVCNNLNPDAGKDSVKVKLTLYGSVVSFFERMKLDPWKFQVKSMRTIAGEFTTRQLSALCGSSEVEAIIRDESADEDDYQVDPSWGQARLLNMVYGLRPSSGFPKGKLGEGVDIYVLDTGDCSRQNSTCFDPTLPGVYTDHTDFGNRARSGISTTHNEPGARDLNGHGTHSASAAAGSIHGVAKRANIIAVKAFNGRQRPIDEIALAHGLWYVYHETSSNTKSKRPSIVLLSGQGTAGSSLPNAVIQLLTDSGVHVVIAAGDNNKDAHYMSPANATTAITVGALGYNNARAHFSNHGSVVDAFAPGVGIGVAGIGSRTDRVQVAGTSVAAGLVAGLVACLINLYNNKLSPAEMTLNVKGILEGHHL